VGWQGFAVGVVSANEVEAEAGTVPNSWLKSTTQDSTSDSEVAGFWQDFVEEALLRVDPYMGIRRAAGRFRNYTRPLQFEVQHPQFRMVVEVHRADVPAPAQTDDVKSDPVNFLQHDAKTDYPQARPGPSRPGRQLGLVAG